MISEAQPLRRLKKNGQQRLSVRIHDGSRRVGAVGHKLRLPLYNHRRRRRQEKEQREAAQNVGPGLGVPVLGKRSKYVSRKGAADALVQYVETSHDQEMYKILTVTRLQ